MEDKQAERRREQGGPGAGQPERSAGRPEAGTPGLGSQTWASEETTGLLGGSEPGVWVRPHVTQAAPRSAFLGPALAGSALGLSDTDRPGSQPPACTRPVVPAAGCRVSCTGRRTPRGQEP